MTLRRLGEVDATVDERQRRGLPHRVGVQAGGPRRCPGAMGAAVANQKWRRLPVVSSSCGAAHHGCVGERGFGLGPGEKGVELAGPKAAHDLGCDRPPGRTRKVTGIPATPKALAESIPA